MPEPQDTNERFNRLWDEIGAKRVLIGSEEKGVEIVVDADLSIFGVLEKLKDASRSGHAKDQISDHDQKKIASTLEECARAFAGGVQDKLRRQFDKLRGKGH